MRISRMGTKFDTENFFFFKSKQERFRSPKVRK